MEDLGVWWKLCNDEGIGGRFDLVSEQEVDEFFGNWNSFLLLASLLLLKWCSSVVSASCLPASCLLAFSQLVF
jgi:hypothetical protein